MRPLECESVAEGELETVLGFMRDFYTEENLAWGPACEEAARKLAARSEPGRLILLQEERKPVGYFVLTFGYSIERGGKTALLDELYVLPDSRSRGIGRAALKAAAEIARIAGCRAICLEVDQQNTRARHFYDTAGFKNLDRDYLALAL